MKVIFVIYESLTEFREHLFISPEQKLENS